MSLADLSLEELGDVPITSVSRRSEKLSEAPTSIFVITADDIRRSGAATLPEVLRLAPNLHVAQASNGGYAVSARGFNSSSANKLLVLIDGRSVYTPLFGGVFWDAQSVMLEDVDRIEVISGPGGTLWGLNAVNGIINVITRPATAGEGSLALAEAGNRGHRVAARASLGSADGALRLYAQNIYRGRTRTAAGSDVADALRMSQAGFRADWGDADSRDRVALHGDVYSGRSEHPRPGTIVLTGVNFRLGDIPLSGANIAMRWDRRAGPGLWTVQAYFDRTERGARTIFAERLSIADIQVQYAAARTARHAWVAGAEFRYSQDRVSNDTPFFGFLPARVDQRWSSVFVQDEIDLPARLKLTLGGRVERNDYTGNEFLPSMRLAWQAAERHLVWGAVSRTVRAPSRFDRDVYYPAAPRPAPQPPFVLAGGPGVRSEIAKVFELGYRGQPAARLAYAVTVYRALYDDLRTQQLAPTRDWVYFANGMQGTVNGIETWLTWQPADNWRIHAGLSGMRMKLWLKPGSNDAAAPYAESADPARTWSLRSSVDLSSSSELDLMVRHVSALVSGPPGGQTVVPDYTAFDMRLGWRPSPRLELSLSGQNLFGSQHAEFTAIETRSLLGPAVALEAVYRF